MNRDSDTMTFDIIGAEGLSDEATVKLPSPTLVEYYTRMHDRTIYLNYDIDDDFVDFYQHIIKWNKEDEGKPVEERKPIKFFINTNGGSISAVFAIIDLILKSKTPVITIGLGKCYSSGGLLLMAGHKRLILPNTTILIHDGSSGMEGATGKMFDNMEFMKKLEQRMESYICSRTSITEEVYEKNYRKDWWLFSDEAIQYKIADKVITDLSELY